MKKILLLLVSMLLAFAACEKPDSDTDSQKEDQEQGRGQKTEENYRSYIREIYGDESRQTAPIYCNKHVDLYKEELDAHLDSPAEVEQLISHWGDADTFIYGRWAMLKRIGKAQAEVGCEDYELLLPIPQIDMDRNSKISQNPGY